MSIEEIIKKLDKLAQKHERCADSPSLAPIAPVYLDTAQALRAAIEKLKTHPDNQPNEPLTYDELMGMSGKPVWVEFSDETRPTWGVTIGTVIYLPCCNYCEARRDGFGEGWKAYRRPPEETP